MDVLGIVAYVALCVGVPLAVIGFARVVGYDWKKPLNFGLKEVGPPPLWLLLLVFSVIVLLVVVGEALR